MKRISMVDSKREKGVVKQEASTSILGGYYVLGWSMHIIPIPILRDVKTLQDN